LLAYLWRDWWPAGKQSTRRWLVIGRHIARDLSGQVVVIFVEALWMYCAGAESYKIVIQW